MSEIKMHIHEENLLLHAKYNVTAWFYDILDFPWELQYRRWRPALLGDLRGSVLEAGVGTGRNLKYYHHSVDLTGIDLSMVMLDKALKRARAASCNIDLVQEDAIHMKTIPASQFDWIIATFLCCVMPDKIQPLAIEQFERVLKPGGRFRLLEMLYSKNPEIRRRQEFIAPFIEKVYNARFDRKTLEYIENSQSLKIENTYFLKEDIYLVIEGVCEKKIENRESKYR